jgi:hypothetical protein
MAQLQREFHGVASVVLGRDSILRGQLHLVLSTLNCMRFTAKTVAKVPPQLQQSKFNKNNAPPSSTISCKSKSTLVIVVCISSIVLSSSASSVK